MSGGGSCGTVVAADVIELIRGEGIAELDSGFGPDDDLFVAGLDSLALMQLLVLVRERFGVALRAGDMTRENLRTPRLLAALIERRNA